MSYYPETLKTILIYIEALDAADKRVNEEVKHDAPYLEKVALKDTDDTHYGWLVDEIGGSWSWVPDTSRTHEDGESGS